METDAALPLLGVRVLDLTHNWAGPHATRILADFGAEVVKVEYVRRMDGMRGGRKGNQEYNHHPRWLEINRNKLSMTLDLRADWPTRRACRHAGAWEWVGDAAPDAAQEVVVPPAARALALVSTGSK